VALLGAAVVGVLLVAHWGAARDHVEAWHFQLTRETVMMEGCEEHATISQAMCAYAAEALEEMSCGRPILFCLLPECLGSPVIVDPTFSYRAIRGRKPWGTSDVLCALKENGFRLEQRFPRKAYVVIRDQGATP
jgi:hypothetical protein